MYKIYVAGSYSSDNVLGVLTNIRKGLRKSTEILLKGYAVFSPWCDYSLNLQLREDEQLTVEQLQEHSMAWLGSADAVFVLPNSENSKGTQNEIARAMTLEIPVFTTIEAMDNYFKGGQ
jgi:nucleoside 2-deoxyribosyltransferase